MFSKKIVVALKLFDTAVLEHLIIAAGYYSFAENGVIRNAGAAYLFSINY